MGQSIHTLILSPSHSLLSPIVQKYTVHSVTVGWSNIPLVGHFQKRACTVGWSDFHFLSIFENRHIAIDWLHFYEFNSKKSANFAVAANFSFLKNHRDLVNQYFFGNLQKPSSCIKEQLSKVKFKLRIC